MTTFPIKYTEPIYRPPAEASSLLIPVTIGCSHNRCAFCAMYRTKRFKVRTSDEINKDLRNAAKYLRERGQVCRKIFFCDGDALAAPFDLLASAAQGAQAFFPKLRRISLYASARNIMEKSIAELSELAQLKLNLAYAGLESGSDEILNLVSKGFSAQDMITASKKLQAAGWQLSLIVMLGLGGKALSKKHVQASAEVVSACAPTFLSFLTTVPVPETPYYERIEMGETQPLTSRELLEEMHAILEQTTPQPGTRIIFRANHVSNLFPLEGILPRDTEKLLSILKKWIAACPAGHYPSLDPRCL